MSPHKIDENCLEEENSSKLYISPLGPENFPLIFKDARTMTPWYLSFPRKEMGNCQVQYFLSNLTACPSELCNTIISCEHYEQREHLIGWIRSIF